MKKLLTFFRTHELSGPLGVFAIFRFCVWQLKSRLIRKVFVHNWIGKSKFYVTKGETGLTGNVYVGLHEFSDMSFLIHFLRPGDCFVDVGSNSGSYTILASGVIGAKSVSVEPVPSTYLRLLANVKLNEIEHLVRAQNVGLSSESGYLRVTSESDTTNHLVSDGTTRDTKIVKISTLDEVTIDYSPNLVKIDVEGWEFKVLEGGFECLSKESLKAIILEIKGKAEELGYEDSLLFDKLSRFGFHSYTYDPFTRSLTHVNGKNVSGGNTIFIRDLQFVEDRIKAAERRRVLGKVL